MHRERERERDMHSIAYVQIKMFEEVNLEIYSHLNADK